MSTPTRFSPVRTARSYESGIRRNGTATLGRSPSNDGTHVRSPLMLSDLRNGPMRARARSESARPPFGACAWPTTRISARGL
jgi:hypothetical protein